VLAILWDLFGEQCDYRGECDYVVFGDADFEF
jgi:hypothetical protein